MFRFKKIKFDRTKTIIAFIIAIIVSVIYFVFNSYNENLLMNFISNNLWIQTIVIFLTISSLINIFYPFTIRKELNKKDLEFELNKFEEKLKEDEEFRKRCEGIL